MKKLAIVAVTAVLGLWATAGCETPGLSTQERFQQIGRNWGYEYEQIQYDTDLIFLLNPPSHLTRFNIR